MHPHPLPALRRAHVAAAVCVIVVIRAHMHRPLTPATEPHEEVAHRLVHLLRGERAAGAPRHRDQPEPVEGVRGRAARRRAVEDPTAGAPVHHGEQASEVVHRGGDVDDRLLPMPRAPGALAHRVAVRPVFVCRRRPAQQIHGQEVEARGLVQLAVFRHCPHAEDRVRARVLRHTAYIRTGAPLGHTPYLAGGQRVRGAAPGDVFII
eukprot:scaffold48035_cov30-Phaeocystis_antarctica.AAC.2